MKTILHYLQIHAPPAKVFEALTTRDGLAGWWSTDVRAAPGLGVVVDFRFLEGFNPDMEVVALEADRRLEWMCVGGHEPWTDNTFVFELEEKDGGTGLKFTQQYARELPDEVYGNYNFNWGYYLHSLKKLCESGEGTPHRAGAG